MLNLTKCWEYSDGKSFLKLNYFFFYPSQSLSFSHLSFFKHYLRVLIPFRTYHVTVGTSVATQVSTHSFLTCQREAKRHPHQARSACLSCFCKPHQPILFEQWFYRPRVYDITITRSNLRGITNRIFFII